MAAADTVLFAIQGGLQLYGAVRKAYVDATRGRPLVLPLPRSQGIDWSSALTWFDRGGSSFVDDYPRVAELIELDELDDEQKRELTELYRAIRAVVLPEEADNAGARGLISADELSALVTVRQWEAGKFGPDPTALQHIAGTVVNLSIDYFLETPGAISDRRPEGRALRAFLEVVDTTDFATEAVTDIAPDLLVAVLDSVAANPDLISGGAKEQLLVKNVVGSLAGSARERLADATARERADASLWIQLVARSLIEGGAGTILANPACFFDVGPGEADLIGRVGSTAVDLVTGPEGVTVRRLVSGDGLDTLVRSMLAAVAVNPELLAVGNEGLRNVIVAVADELADAPELFAPDVFPDLVALILARTAENVELIVGGDLDDPAEHLLLTAVSTLLAELGRVRDGDSRWRPRLTPEQLIALADAIFDEVVDNPAWLLERAGGDTLLAETIRAVVEALREVEGSKVSSQTGLLIVRAGLHAVSRRLDFLDELPAQAGQEARIALTAALDAVFGTVFADGVDPEAAWNLARNSALLAVVEVALSELAEFGASAEGIDALRATVQATLESGAPLRIDDFAEDLRGRLAA